MNIFTSGKLALSARLCCASITLALLVPGSTYAQSPAPVALGSASTFVILAGQSITNTGNTVLSSNIGVWPGSTITGYPPGKTSGHIYIATAEAQTAQSDLTTAYNDAAGRAIGVINTTEDIGGQTLAPGLYKAPTSLQVTGDLTLDAGGNANGVWIFQSASTLTTNISSHIVLKGGAQAKNIFWQVGSSATINGSIFYGTILAFSSISLGSGVTMVGRSLARNGSSTFAGEVSGSNPDSLPSNMPIFTTASRNIVLDSLQVDTMKWKTITISNTGTADLIITAATSSNVSFSSHLSGTTITPGAQIDDTIKYKPASTGPDSTRLLFLSNAASSPDTIVVRTKQAMFSTVSRNINVGTTHVDSALWTLVTITNTGTDTLRFSTVTSSKNVFVSGLSAQKLAPGASIIDTVKYTPLAVGSDTAKLIFTGNGMSTPDTIIVRGTGRAAKFSTVSRSVNMGSTHVNTALWTLITITNSGTDTLRFTAVTSNRPTFTSRMTALKVAPGASVIDSVKFLPLIFGADSARLIFTSNGLAAPDTIVVRGIGKAAVLATNSRDVNCGATLVGTPTWTIVTLANAGNDTLRILSATSTNPAFSSRLSETVIAPGGSVVDMIVFTPTAPGATYGQLSFISNAITSPDMISVSGTGIAAAKAAIFATASRNVDVGTTLIGTAKWALITLTNTGNDTLRIASSTSTNGVFSSHLSALTIAPGAWIIDSIKFLPTLAGAVTGKLIFVGNSATSPDTIAVYGTGVTVIRGAILATASRSVDCGTVEIGKHTWTLLTLYNTGTDPLRITAATLTNGAFVSHLSDSVIAPGMSSVVLIVFLPTAVGTAAGTLTITSNAITSPDQIEVHGVGTTVSSVDDGLSPVSTSIGEVYPNPFSDATQLRLQLHDGEQIKHIAMYDMLGRELQDWTSRLAGNGTLSLHLGQYPNGRYIVRLQTSARVQMLPMMIAR